MAQNIPMKNVEKGIESAVIVTISTAIAVIVVMGLHAIKIEVDKAQVATAIIIGLSALLSAFKNWLKHRATKKAEEKK